MRHGCRQSNATVWRSSAGVACCAALVIASLIFVAAEARAADDVSPWATGGAKTKAGDPDGLAMAPTTTLAIDILPPWWQTTLARALFALASKGHDVFATVHGSLVHDLDREVVGRLWNPFVAAWYEEGKDDPKLALLRFDPDEAQIWRNGSSMVAGAKALLGIDPKRDYRKNVADVRLDAGTGDAR